MHDRKNEYVGVRVDLKHTHETFQPDDILNLESRMRDKKNEHAGFRIDLKHTATHEAFQPNDILGLISGTVNKPKATARLSGRPELSPWECDPASPEIWDVLESNSNRTHSDLAEGNHLRIREPAIELNRKAETPEPPEPPKKESRAMRAAWWFKNIRKIVDFAVTHKSETGSFPVVSPRIGELLKGFLPKKSCEQIYEPLYEEYKEEYLLDFRRCKTAYARRRLKLYFVFRTAGLVWGCLRVTIFAKVRKLILGLVPEPVRRFLSS